MMIDGEKIKIIIGLLEIRTERPGMYFLDFSHCIGFIWGVYQMSYSFGIITFEEHDKIHKEVSAELGYKYLANSPAMLIRDKDWDEHQKIRELLKIEIAVWRRILASLNE